MLATWSSTGVIAYLLQDMNDEDLDIWVLPPGGEPMPFFQSNSIEAYATFSPDGRWLAYASDQAGRFDVYVRPYPGPDPATVVSSAGGQSPLWSPDGRRLYYLESATQDPERLKMMAVDIVTDGDFDAGRPIPLIDPWPYQEIRPTRGYDVFPDGSFVAALRSDGGLGTDLNSARLRYAVG